MMPNLYQNVVAWCAITSKAAGCHYSDMAQYRYGTVSIWHCEVISALSLITFTALADGRSSVMHGLSPGPFSIHQDLSVTIRNAAITATVTVVYTIYATTRSVIKSGHQFMQDLFS